MFFRFLGQLVRRAWPILLVAWIALLLTCRLTAPAWNAVAKDEEFALLPADAPSRRAAENYAKAFPEDQTASNIVLVLHRAGSRSEHLDADLKFIEDVVEPGLRQIAAAEGGLAA